jgi:hypothetical protein
MIVSKGNSLLLGRLIQCGGVFSLLVGPNALKLVGSRCSSPTAGHSGLTTLPKNAAKTEAREMTQNDAEWRLELEESAQGTDLFEAPGDKIQMDEAYQAAKEWSSGEDDGTVLTVENLSSKEIGKAAAVRGSLRGAMHALEQVAASASMAEGWGNSIREAVTQLRNEFDAHVQITEGEGGLLEEISQEAPRLAVDIAIIRNEHDEIYDTLELVELTVATALEMEGSDPEALRGRITTLLSRLSLHRQRGADLVYDAYNVDIATAD